jgi:hypothetical protein
VLDSPPIAVTEAKIAAVVERLAAFARPSRILIFGSAARGRLGPDSDLDLLVIMPTEVPNWRAASSRLRREARGIVMAMDILVISEAEAAAAPQFPDTVVATALREGRLAYTRATAGTAP